MPQTKDPITNNLRKTILHLREENSKLKEENLFLHTEIERKRIDVAKG